MVTTQGAPEWTRKGIAIVLGILLLHMIATPLAIGATIYFYGRFEQNDSAQTLFQKCMLWTPILHSQLNLLVLYLGIGSGKTHTRCFLFLEGIALLLVVNIWTSYLFGFIPSWSTSAMYSRWKYHAVLKEFCCLVALPTIVLGVLLLLSKLLLGSLRVTQIGTPHRFGIADLFAVTFMIAIIVSVAKLAASEHFQDAASITSILENCVLDFVCVVGCFLFAFSRFWWLGLLMVASGIAGLAGLGVTTQHIPVPAWKMEIFSWVIVAITLLGFRLAGYRPIQ